MGSQGKEREKLRKELRKIDGTRKKFTGTFIRTGTKNGYMGTLETVLLSNILDEKGALVADHLWFNFTKGFAKASLSKDDRIEFHARVKEYVKGYKGYREDVYVPISTDYKLSHPTRIKRISSSYVRTESHDFQRTKQEGANNVL